ncbi:hypothetical protein [Actinoplanes atraurantiacus]
MVDVLNVVISTAISIASLLLAYMGWVSSGREDQARIRAQSAVSSALEKLPAAEAGQRTWDRLREQLDEPAVERIARITGALSESQRLIAELQAEVDTKLAAVERLRAEEEQNRQLAAMREEEAEAVRRLLRTTIESAHDELRAGLEHERDDLRVRLQELQSALDGMRESSRKDQIRFFVYGVGVSIPIGILINIFV